MLIDDRDERPGIKFKDADLVGIPYRVTVGKGLAADGTVEVRTRRDGVTEAVAKEEVVARLTLMIGGELKKLAAASSR